MAHRTSPVAAGAGSDGVDSYRGEWIDDRPGEWERKDTAVAPGQPREGRVRLEEDYRHRRVPLRNGAGEMTLVKAVGAKEDLHLLLDDDPALFQALRALAEGRREDASREQVRALQREGFVMGAGRVRGDLQMVMRASYEERDGKASIVEPFDMTNPNDAAAVIRWREACERSGTRAQALIKRLGEAERERQGRS